MGRRRRLLPPNTNSILTLLAAALKRKVQKSLPLASKPVPDPFLAEQIAYLKEMPNHPDVPRWRDIPALKDILPVVSFSDVSELHLDLDPNFHKSVHCYASLLHVLTKHGVACDVPLILSFMTHACVTGKDRSLVIDVYKQYKSCLTRYCYEDLLDSLARSDKVPEMREVYVDMLDVVSSPGLGIFNIMITAYCRPGHVVESQQYVCKMIQSGLTPNLTTFTSLIMGYCRTGDADAALRVFQRNMVQQYGCVPDLKCYEQLMNGICEANKLGIAWMLLDQMQKEGLPPSGIVFERLLRCCCVLHKYGEAANIVEDMILNGFTPELKYCRILVCGLYEQGRNERARQVFRKLLQCEELYDDEIAWRILIGGVLKKRGLAGGAFSQLFQEMQKSGSYLSLQTRLMLKQGLQGITDPIT